MCGRRPHGTRLPAECVAAAAGGELGAHGGDEQDADRDKRETRGVDVNVNPEQGWYAGIVSSQVALMAADALADESTFDRRGTDAFVAWLASTRR
jgi:hypothetical protein